MNIKKGKKVKIDKTVVINSPVEIGNNVHIDQLAVVGPNVTIENNVIIGSNTVIQNSIIKAGTYVGKNLEITDMVLDQDSIISTKTGEKIEVVDKFICAKVSSVKKALLKFI